MRYLLATAAVLCRLGVDALFIGPRDDCPTGWLKNGEKCYLFQHTGLMSSATCKDYCASASSNGFPARRLCIQSQDEQDFVARSLNGPTWLGYTYVHVSAGLFDWNWGEGDSAPRCNSNQNFWAEHNPQYIITTETVMMQPSFGGRWTDSQFAHEGKCACEMPSTSVPVLRHCPDGYTMGPSNKCYKFFPTTASTFYKGCATTCASESSRMFCVESPQEAQFIRYNIPIGGVDNAAWLGFSDAAQEGTWVWSEGCRSTYNRQTAPWAASQPDNLLAFQHYGVARWGSGWDDVGEADHLYVCGCERPAERFLPRIRSNELKPVQPVQDEPPTPPDIPVVFVQPAHPHCADGYIMGPTNKKCYKFFPSTMRTTYHNCESTCASESSSVPNVESRLEAQFFRDNVPYVDFNSAVWVRYPDSFVKNEPGGANILGRFKGGWYNFMLHSHYGCSCERPAVNEPKEPVLPPVQPVQPVQAAPSRPPAIPDVSVQPSHCADGYIMGPTKKKCYKFYPATMQTTYHNCESTCASDFGRIPHVESTLEFTFFIENVPFIDSSSAAWVTYGDFIPFANIPGGAFYHGKLGAWDDFSLKSRHGCACERNAEEPALFTEGRPQAPAVPEKLHCPERYISGPSNMCYKFFPADVLTTFQECQSTCASESSRIVESVSGRERQFIQENFPFATTLGQATRLWVGSRLSSSQVTESGAGFLGHSDSGWITFDLNPRYGCGCQRQSDPVSDLCPAGTIRKDNQCVEKETQRAEPVGGDAVPYYWDGYNKHFIRNGAEKEFVLSIISADAGKSFTDNSAPDEPTADWAPGQAASCDPSLTSDSPQAERRRRRALRIQQLQERLHVLQRRARADPSPPPCNSTSSSSSSPSPALPQEQQLPCRDWRPFPRPFGTVVKYLRDYEEYKEYVRESCLV